MRDAALLCWCARYTGAVQRMPVGHEIHCYKVIKLVLCAAAVMHP